ncbi:hypothetical protein [Candidatus Amarolinea dominans]|uniref:hypothetical protein n=1 Tax=Candidatus Amarolinea dominans TaxID=3140696 RepID=UPI001DC1869E|nr:hypothetical protein [Anaerolineae bacterium]
MVAEYKPVARLAFYSVLGRNENDYRNLAADVRSRLNQSQIDFRYLSFLRELPTAPRKLIGPGGVSDPDLSLVALGLHLADQGESVYILSNDKDLVDFSTWARRAKAELRQRWANPSLLQGLQSLAYLEWVHQSCSIATDDMWQLLKYYMREHVAREDLGKLKGEAIFQSLMDITTSLVESAQIKAQARITNV